MNLALAWSLARDAILESAVVELKRRLKLRQRERRLRSRWRAAVRWRLRKKGHPMWVHHHRHEYFAGHIYGSRWYDWITGIWTKIFRCKPSGLEDPAWKMQYGPRHKRLNVDALADEDLHAAALETGAPLSRLVPEELRVPRKTLPQHPTIEHGQELPSSMSLTLFRLGGMLALMGNFAVAFTRGGTPYRSESASDTDIAENSAVEDNNEDADNVARPDEPEGNSNGDANQEMGDTPRPITHGVPLTTTATIHDDILMQTALEEDAKNLFSARLSIALSLFLTFWVVSYCQIPHLLQWTKHSLGWFDCFHGDRRMDFRVCSVFL